MSEKCRMLSDTGISCLAIKELVCGKNHEYHRCRFYKTEEQFKEEAEKILIRKRKIDKGEIKI